MRKTDYFVGIHGAGLTLAIFAPKHCIFHEVLHSYNMNGLLLMASLSGHKTYSDIVSSQTKFINPFVCVELPAVKIAIFTIIAY